jgi:hypothetical protein
MHVLQWIAVEADSLEDSVAAADSHLSVALGDPDSPSSWFDWYVVGGGRWNPEQDPYHNSDNMVISYDTDPNAFRAKIDELIANRIETYNEYHNEIKGKDIMAMFENYTGTMTYSLDTYPLRNLLRMLQGDWFYDSKFFDFTAYSTNATYILSKLDNNEGKNLFLVPIDFHF